MSKLQRAIRNPVGTLKSVLGRMRERRKYSTADGYDAERYWRDRHSKYGFDFRGVGNKGLSDEENRKMYAEAAEVFCSVCRAEQLDLAACSVLDVGCGVGFYSDLCKSEGVTDYTGIDITSVLFRELQERYPGYRYEQKDITKDSLGRPFDVVLMIDVTQHITTPELFSFAMQNIRGALGDSGVLIVTSWLCQTPQKLFYEVKRTLDDYKREFPDGRFSEPRPFRDKYIFSIRMGGPAS